MTDRELLELAAKAAGIKVWFDDNGQPWIDGDKCVWNPLIDDGDALRLAVKLRLTIKHDDPDAGSAGIAKDQAGAPTLDGNGPWFRKEWHKYGGPLAATRRAIVRAAAVLGRSKE